MPLDYESQLTELQAEIDALKSRNADLEDALMELAPFAACFEVLAQTTLSAPNDEACRKKAYSFKRDTLFMNKFAYRRAASLIKDRLIENGADYIFEP